MNEPDGQDPKLEEGLYEQAITKQLSDLIFDSFGEYKKSYLVRPIEQNQIDNLLIVHIRSILYNILNEMEDADYNSKIRLINEVLEKLSQVTHQNKILAQKISDDVYYFRELKSETKDSLVNNAPRSLIESQLYTGTSLINFSEILKKEIETSDSVDLIIAFIRITGLREIESAIDLLLNRGGTLRVITSTYTGTTEVEAVDALARKSNNVQVKISFDMGKTRLHSKAFIFHRRSGFSTAIVGSSNLTKTALTTGDEWNVRIAAKDNPQLYNTIERTYESYWGQGDEYFHLYDPKIDYERLRDALRSQRSKTLPVGLNQFQEAVLRKIQNERYEHNNWRNLLVAATGTGKTRMAAYDYKRYLDGKPSNTNLLFVAPSKEIAKHALDTFRLVLNDSKFGELCYSGEPPAERTHVFAVYKSVKNKLADLPEDHFGYIVIDEVHHIAAKSYGKIFIFRPQVLLGLTATPFRTDGESIFNHFNNKISANLSLRTSIDNGLLVPFHYYCINDDVDYVSFKKMMDGEALDKLYLENDERVHTIISELKKHVSIDNLRCLAFCSSVKHAEYMQHQFEKIEKESLPSIVVAGDSKHKLERKDAIKYLESGKIKVIFAVDVYNEGVDVPSINTVMFLRPTESLNIFVQQLGRGLRLDPQSGKSDLTVLDFVGRFNGKYDVIVQKLQYLSEGITKDGLRNGICNGLRDLPDNCVLELDEKSKEDVLNVLEQYERRIILSHLVRNVDLPPEKILPTKLMEVYNLEIGEIYHKRTGGKTITGTLVEVGSINLDNTEMDRYIFRGLTRIKMVDDDRLLEYLCSSLKNVPIEEDLKSACYENMILSMFYLNKEFDGKTFDQLIKTIQSEKYYLREVLDVLDYQINNIRRISDSTVTYGDDLPLRIHCSYSLAQIAFALGKSTYYEPQRGLFEVEDQPVMAVTFWKDPKRTVRGSVFKDYAIDCHNFHWQTPNNVGDEDDSFKKLKTKPPLLFVRETKENRFGETNPYVFLGPAKILQNTGSKPVGVIFHMNNEIPERILEWAGMQNTSMNET